MQPAHAIDSERPARHATARPANGSGAALRRARGGPTRLATRGSRPSSPRRVAHLWRAWLQFVRGNLPERSGAEQSVSHFHFRSPNIEIEARQPRAHVPFHVPFSYFSPLRAYPRS